MRKSVVAGILVILLFASASFHFQFADTSTRQDLVSALGNMEIPYTLELYFGQGVNQVSNLNAPIDIMDNVMFRNTGQIYDRIQISYNFGIDPFMTGQAQALENISRFDVNGHEVTVNEFERNGEKIAMNFVYWTSGDFNVILTMDDVDPIFRDENIALIDRMVKMIDRALSGIQVDTGFMVEMEEEDDEDEEGSDEEVQDPDVGPEQDKKEDEEVKGDSEEETYPYSLQLEMNSETGSEYKGLTAGKASSLKIHLDLGPSFAGTIYVHPLEYGQLDGAAVGEEIPFVGGKHVLAYYPPEYLSSDQKNVIESITVDVYSPGKDGGASDKSGNKDFKKTIRKTIEIRRPPVMLVHGFTGDASTWALLDEHIRALGFETVREYYVYNDKDGQSIPAQAKGLARHIRDRVAKGEKDGIKTQDVDVVAHSMGGLITRHLISRLPHLYDGNIRKLIMVGTPNNGCGDFDNYFGWGLAKVFDMHREAADQLYYRSPFILDLNKDVKDGLHLDPKVQYGLIYGSGVGSGDGVVDTTSALLSGVHSVPFFGLTHSPVMSMLGPSLTEDQKVFDQITEWLVTDIPLGEYRWIDMSIDSIVGEAYIANENYVKDDIYWERLSESDTRSIDLLEDLKTEEGRLNIVLRAGGEVFGTVEMDVHTEMYFEYASPYVMRVNLSSGAARFKSRPNSGNHFEVTLNASGKIQTVRGYKTDYVVESGAEPLVYCLEGELETIYATSEKQFQTAKLKTGQAVKLVDVGGFEQIALPEDHWWSDDSDTSDIPIPESLWQFLEDYREYLIGAAIAFGVILLLKLIRRPKGRR